MKISSALIVAAALFAAWGCNKSATGATTAKQSSENASSKSALDQYENKADLALTQQVRKAVMNDDTLSTMAKNVTVISQNGVVTLKGTVASSEEKTRIGEKAQVIAGLGHVENQISVQPK